MSMRRSGAAVTTMDGYLLVAGGFDGHVQLNLVERYDPQANIWTRMPGMNVAREGLGLVVVPQGKIVPAARRRST